MFLNFIIKSLEILPFKKFEKFYKSKNRKIILIIIDLIIINLSFILIYKDNLIFFSENPLIRLLILFSWIILYLITGQYRSITSYIGSQSVYYMLARNIASCILMMLVELILSGKSFPDKYLSIILFNTFFGAGLRIVLRDLILSLRSSNEKVNKNKKVVIYGAGIAGAQLLKSIKLSNKYNVIGFIDDNKKICGLEIDGIKIYSPKELSRFRDNISTVLMALPKISNSRRREIVLEIKKYELEVFQVPSFEELSVDINSINRLKKIEIEDLLCREAIKPIDKLFGPAIKNKIICITGAGGSIGSQLCKELIELNPAKLLLIEISEINLYTISNNLKKLNPKIEVISVLGNVCDEIFLDKIFSKFNIDVLIHAAAYKHVPIVESNPISGIINNFLSTHILCKKAIDFKIKKMVLISTDKAVRPTNIMGASKRLSEKIVNYYAHLKPNQLTNFSMVRFGNVLGSSGSVVNLFKEQIKNGGPITLTHSKIVRFFMTVKEASQLVIQSIHLSKQGDLFLLDMGEAIPIKKLAEQMIQLSGLKIKNKQNPNGDIEIVITKLRDGEKLYEELLVNVKSEITAHPRIFRAKEEFHFEENFIELITILEEKILNKKTEESLSLLKKLVPDWERNKSSHIII